MLVLPYPLCIEQAVLIIPIYWAVLVVSAGWLCFTKKVNLNEQEPRPHLSAEADEDGRRIARLTNNGTALSRSSVKPLRFPMYESTYTTPQGF